MWAELAEQGGFLQPHSLQVGNLSTPTGIPVVPATYDIPGRSRIPHCVVALRQLVQPSGV